MLTSWRLPLAAQIVPFPVDSTSFDRTSTCLLYASLCKDQGSRVTAIKGAGEYLSREMVNPLSYVRGSVIGYVQSFFPLNEA